MKIGTRLPFALLVGLFVASAGASAETPAGDLRARSSAAVAWIAGSERLPYIKLRPDLAAQMKFPLDKKHPITAATENIFRRLEALISAKPTFRLAPISAEGMFSQVEKKIIYLNAELLAETQAAMAPEERESAAAFILAHELGHYIYEAWAIQSPDHLGPFGRRSYALPFVPMSEEGHEIHGDVDLIGMELMERAGFDKRLAPKALAKLVEVVLRKHPGMTAREVPVRLEAMERMLREGADTPY